MTFKVGDKVFYQPRVSYMEQNRGATGVVVKHSYADCFQIKWDGNHGLNGTSTESIEVLAPVAPARSDAFGGPYRTSKVVKTWIIAVLDAAGKPQPSTTPAVYSSEKQAETVAKEMAKKHPGETFMVFQGTHVAAQPKVVEVELVRL